MSAFWPAESATGCVGTSMPGTIALETGLLAEYAHAGARSLGIYACRPPRGGVGWSVHAEGRALDLGVNYDQELGIAVLNGLRSSAWELGLQRIIFWDVQYDAHSPSGKLYTGDDPHHSHLHIEQTRSAATTLKLSDVVRVIDGWETGMALSEDQVAAIVRRVLAEGKGYGQPSWPSTVQTTLKLTQGLTNAVAALYALIEELIALAGPTDTSSAQGAESTPTDTVDDRSGPAGGVAGGAPARTQGPADPSGYPQPGGSM